MRKILLLTAVVFISLSLFSQELQIEPLGLPLLKGDLRDTVVIKEGKTNKTVHIKLLITKTNKDVSLTADDLLQNNAEKDIDYSFADALPNNYSFGRSNNWANIIKLTVIPNSNKKDDEFAELDLKWESLTEENKTLHKILVIKIIDADVKESAIAEAEKSEDLYKHKDNTNGNKHEYIQYTDFAGFDNDKPNGRLQSELRFKWGIAKTWHGQEGKFQFQFLRAVIFPDILLNRIEKSQKEESYNYQAFLKGSPNADSAAPKFTTMDIWKYSNLHIGARVVLFAVKKDNFRFHFQAGARVVRNKPFVDTTVLQSGKTDSAIFRSTTSVAYNMEVFGKTLLNEKENINLDFNAGIMWLYLHDSYYKQYDAAVIDQYNKASVLLPVSYPAKKVRPMYMFSFRLTKNFGAEDKNYLYLRGSWMFQSGNYFPVYKRTTNTGQILYQTSTLPVKFYNNFLQIQAGFSLDIKTIFKAKPDDKKEDKKDKTTNVSDAAG